MSTLATGAGQGFRDETGNNIMYHIDKEREIETYKNPAGICISVSTLSQLSSGSRSRSESSFKDRQPSYTFFSFSKKHENDKEFELYVAYLVRVW
jgi:hypothetical protein